MLLVDMEVENDFSEINWNAFESWNLGAGKEKWFYDVIKTNKFF